MLFTSLQVRLSRRRFPQVRRHQRQQYQRARHRPMVSCRRIYRHPLRLWHLALGRHLVQWRVERLACPQCRQRRLLPPCPHQCHRQVHQHQPWRPPRAMHLTITLVPRSRSRHRSQPMPAPHHQPCLGISGRCDSCARWDSRGQAW